MASLIKFIKTLRNNWKKSTFAACALTYGAQYAKESYEIQNMMEKYCKEAQTYGAQPLHPTENPRKILVILNPTANRRKAVKQFEQYCVPLLHLAGLFVEVIQTKSEGHARTILEELQDKTDAVVIAGGDGTICEGITGILRREDNVNLRERPIGVIPLGKTNSFASTVFNTEKNTSNLEQVQRLAEATMAVVKDRTRQANVMKIDDITSNTTKPIYALSGIEWGSYRDAHSKLDKYWYFGTFRKYVTYIFNGYKSSLNWSCSADVTYSPPCGGCNNCYQPPEVQQTNQEGRWWNSFVKNVPQPDHNYQYVFNQECSNVQEKHIQTTDFNLSVNNSNVPGLMLNIGPKSTDLSYLDFITQGWHSEQGETREIRESITARQIELHPTISESNETYYSIDNEDFEVKPIRVTLLPKLIKIFCKD